MNKEFILFDQQRATLRLLFILNNESLQSRMDLINIAKEYGVNQTAVYKNLDTLKQLELIIQNKTNTGQINTELTDKGILIARQIEEIHFIFELLPNTERKT